MFTIVVRMASRWVRIQVSDSGPALLLGPPGNGWGLSLVSAVTDRTGTAYGPGRARTAWAEGTWPTTDTPCPRRQAATPA
jgi:hypothetical protein